MMSLFLMLAGGVFLCGCQKQETESTANSEEIKVEKNQSVVYGQIVSIDGNEMTYYVMEESEGEQEETQEQKEDTAKKERPQMPEGGFSGEMPEGFPGGERPQMPWGNGEAGNSDEKETITVQIPVGTKVTTRLGTETTFSRLAAGDNIKMLVQEEDGEQVILEIWIVD